MAKYAKKAATPLTPTQLEARATGSAARAARAAPPIAPVNQPLVPQPLVPQPSANIPLTLEKALEIVGSNTATEEQKQRAQAFIDNHQSSTAASTQGGRKRKHRTRKQRKQRKQRTHKRNLRRY